MNWKLTALGCAVIVVPSVALYKASALNFWVCLILVVAAILLNGYIATIEDDWPGGFNNPDPPPTNTQFRVRHVTERVLRKLFGRRR